MKKSNNFSIGNIVEVMAATNGQPEETVGLVGVVRSVNEDIHANIGLPAKPAICVEFSCMIRGFHTWFFNHDELTMVAVDMKEYKDHLLYESGRK